jgi:pyruvate/2-oxoglutarate dehydrogenase complex dihydrolipoamide acyltransferase (E2) component
VTVVLAYLIHANAWTLKTSYAYVAERRKGISPNIGFVAELMQFEESELGLRQSSGVHGESSREKDDARAEKGERRHARESLPPAWASSLDSKPPKVHVGDQSDEEGDEGKERRAMGGIEKEIRKNGQWVHQRR